MGIHVQSRETVFLAGMFIVLVLTGCEIESAGGEAEMTTELRLAAMSLFFWTTSGGATQRCTILTCTRQLHKQTSIYDKYVPCIVRYM